MRRLIISAVAVFISLILVIVIWIMIFGPEQYYYFEPYIDTVMAPKYTPEKFDRIQLGMDKSRVQEIIGDPLFCEIDTLGGEVIQNCDYTNDGKILYQKMPWYMCNDYAWYRSIVRYNLDDKVIDLNKGWSYD